MRYGGGNFVLLEDAKIITKTLSRKMQSMVGFRNIALNYNFPGVVPAL